MPDTHITIPMARLIELETAEQERGIFRSERLDLALLVSRLIRRMRAARTGEGIAAGDEALEQQCIGYLRRKGLTSPLPEDALRRQAFLILSRLQSGTENVVRLEDALTAVAAEREQWAKECIALAQLHWAAAEQYGANREAEETVAAVLEGLAGDMRA